MGGGAKIGWQGPVGGRTNNVQPGVMQYIPIIRQHTPISGSGVDISDGGHGQAAAGARHCGHGQGDEGPGASRSPAAAPLT